MHPQSRQYLPKGVPARKLSEKKRAFAPLK